MPPASTKRAWKTTRLRCCYSKLGANIVVTSWYQHPGRCCLLAFVDALAKCIAKVARFNSGGGVEQFAWCCFHVRNRWNAKLKALHCCGKTPEEALDRLHAD